MADTEPSNFSPAYLLFHRWLRENRKRIKAGRDRTVIYSGLLTRGTPIWTKLPELRKRIKALYGVDPNWQDIKAVLCSLDFKAGKHSDGLTLPPQVHGWNKAWTFAWNAKEVVSTREAQQIWLNLSANYARNATGKVWMWQGPILKDYPDLLMAEVPTLLKNTRISAETIERAIALAPTSKARWEKYRAASPADRLAGR